MAISITSVRHAWPESEDFFMKRPSGHAEYTFLHFLTPVTVYFDGKAVSAPPGSCMLYQIGTPQYFKADAPLVHDWMHFTGDPTPLLQKYGLAFDTLYHLKQNRFVTEIIRELEMEFFAQQPYFAQITALKTEELFLKLARNKAADRLPVISEQEQEILRALRLQMMTALEQDWQISRMAAFAHMSPSFLHKQYKALFGLPPVSDLICMRIDKAKFLLKSQKCAVSDIAEQVGFHNPYHFIRQFKKQVGVTPKKYAGQPLV